MLHTTNPILLSPRYKISDIIGWPPNLIPSDFLALYLMSYISTNELHMASIDFVKTSYSRKEYIICIRKSSDVRVPHTTT